ncbi:hypothetical protein SmJEL517_g00841 [Synchytrium microbalum]|uniref:50S ribosomal protein L9, chloroplastic n=1 Tax=Synchytrium microbalum TaxID=1806994 RepID=A0A507CHI4_9FUNG|nr:uncharacterized protein SmJEL517_g00841 [Synchytrium microbalum]TPX37043.1 hypothetical protein SmJEL517_g00841 [Synchytrium microbalum]
MFPAGRIVLRAASGAIYQSRRCKFQKPDTHVYLLQSVATLGEKGDIVQVGLGHARNYLIPFKLAYYVPRLRDKPLLPTNWKPKAVVQTATEQITPAVWTDPIITQQQPTQQQQDDGSIQDRPGRRPMATPSQPSAADILIGALNQRESLDLTVTFKRVRISANESKIYGSVTADDVATELGNILGVTVVPSLVDGERIKSVGAHQMMLKLPTPIPIQVAVVDDE